MTSCSNNSPLNYLNRPGWAALVHHGDFWYPVRVVHKEGPGKW